MAEYAQQRLHRESLANPTAFWAPTVDSIKWTKKPSATLAVSRDDDDDRGGGVGAWTWFPDGEMNMCHEVLDANVERGLGPVPAVIWDSPVTGLRDVITYADLLLRVKLFAGVLKRLGVGKGDVVMIYMPMVPEALVGMYACARLGAIHSVVFGGFAAKELAKRIDSATPKVILTASAGIEEKRVTPYVPLVNAAIGHARHKPGHTILYQRPGHEHRFGSDDGDDLPCEYLDWDTVVSQATPVEECTPTGAHDELYTLYTSGTTGAPKGVSRFASSYAVHLKHSIKTLMDLGPRRVMLCASDIGWVVGHTYIVYAPLLGGCTTVLFEGKVPMRAGREIWRVCEQWRVNVLFCAPTALRALRSLDPDHGELRRRDLSSLRNLMLAGERSEPSIVTAYGDVLQHHVGSNFRGVVDNYWSSESGSPITGVLQALGDAPPGKPGSAGPPTPGYDVRIVDDSGTEVPRGQEGNIVLRTPLPPSMLTRLWRDSGAARFKGSYLARFGGGGLGGGGGKGGWFDTGDAGKIDDDGFVHVTSRADDIINVAAHRLSTGAFEGVIASLRGVSECAVVGMPDAIKGHVPLALIVSPDPNGAPAFDVVNAAVREEIGNIASLAGVIYLTTPLPKTRSGKTLRRTCRSMVENAVNGEPDKVVEVPATIEDPGVLVALQAAVKTFVATRGKAKL